MKYKVFHGIPLNASPTSMKTLFMDKIIFERYLGCKATLKSHRVMHIHVTYWEISQVDSL